MFCGLIIVANNRFHFVMIYYLNLIYSENVFFNANANRTKIYVHDSIASTWWKKRNSSFTLCQHVCMSTLYPVWISKNDEKHIIFVYFWNLPLNMCGIFSLRATLQHIAIACVSIVHFSNLCVQTHTHGATETRTNQF